MKAVLIEDWNPSYRTIQENKFASGDEVEIVDGMQTDGEGIYNIPCGMCYLCRDNEGVASYIPAIYLKITSCEKSIDWEERRYQLAKAAIQGIFAKEDEGDITLHRVGITKDILLVADEMIKQLKGE